MAAFQFYWLANLNQEAFFLQGADSLGGDLHSDFAAVYHKSFLLKVRLPDFLGMALREADVLAILFAFAGDVAFVH